MSSESNDEQSGENVPECECQECSKTLNQIKDFNSHLTKMYSNLNCFNQSIQSQNETLSNIFKELIPMLKGIDARLKQNHAMLSKMSQE